VTTTKMRQRGGCRWKGGPHAAGGRARVQMRRGGEKEAWKGWMKVCRVSYKASGGQWRWCRQQGAGLHTPQGLGLCSTSTTASRLQEQGQPAAPGSSTQRSARGCLGMWPSRSSRLLLLAVGGGGRLPCLLLTPGERSAPCPSELRVGKPVAHLLPREGLDVSRVSWINATWHSGLAAAAAGGLLMGTCRRSRAWGGAGRAWGRGQVRSVGVVLLVMCTSGILRRTRYCHWAVQHCRIRHCH